MGTLKSYENSSGYYIVDYIPSKGFATIQTTGVAKRLFEWVDFTPGDRLPQPLVRAMLDVDLLWTGASSEPPEAVDDYSIEELDTHAVRTGLSPNQYRRLVAFCEHYDGGRREALQELERELNIAGLSISEDDYPDPESLRERQSHSGTSGSIPSGFQSLHKRIFLADKHLPELVQESIRRWGADIEDVLDHDYGPIYAQAFTSYPGAIKSFHISKDQITVEFRTPHPAGLFEEAYAPGPSAEISFRKTELPDLDYREAATESDNQKMFQAAWQAFQIRLQGSYPWEASGKEITVGEDSEQPSVNDVTTSVRRVDEYESTSRISHKAVVQDYEITNWETAFEELGEHKYDTEGRTRPSDLSSIERLAVREQQLGAYRSIACLEKFLPGFTTAPNLGALNLSNPF